MGYLALVLGIVVTLVSLMVMARGSLVEMRDRCRAAWAQVLVELKRRRDLLGTLAEMLNSQGPSFSTGRERLLQACGEAEKAAGLTDRAEAEEQLTAAVRLAIGQAKSVPALSASTDLASIRQELTSTANRITYAVQSYNEAVAAYNQKRRSFLGSLLSVVFRMSAMKPFEMAGPEHERSFRKAGRDFVAL